MRNEGTVFRLGNSLAVRIPSAIARRAGLREADSVKVSVDRGRGRRRYELAELVSRITEENRHGETWWD